MKGSIPVFVASAPSIARYRAPTAATPPVVRRARVALLGARSIGTPPKGPLHACSRALPPRPRLPALRMARRRVPHQPSGTPSTPARPSTPCSTCARRSRRSGSRRTTSCPTPPSPDGRRRPRRDHPAEVKAALDAFAEAGLIGGGMDEALGGMQLPHRGPARFDGVVPGRQHRHLGVPDAHRGQRQPAARPRLRRADRHVRAADARRPVLRHDVPVRAAGGLVARRHHHPRRAADDGTYRLDRHQDVDLRRRPRAGREHRAPGAREDPGRPAGGQGHLAVPRAQVLVGRRQRRAQRRRARGPQPQDGLPRHREHPAELRRGHAHPGRSGRGGRLSGRGAEPGPRLHVPHDERGAGRRRHRARWRSATPAT